MEEMISKVASSQGLWALLFVFLLFWVLKTNAQREQKYQSIIETLSNKFEDIKTDVKELKNRFDEWMVK